MKRKKFHIILLAFTMLLLAGCQNSAQPRIPTSTDPEDSSPVENQAQDPAIDSTQEAHRYRISVGCSTMIDCPQEYVCDDGSIIEFALYPDSILGDDLQMLRGCQADSLSVFKGASIISTEVVPEVALLAIPNLIQDDGNIQMTSQELMDWFQPYYQENGLQLLNFYSHGSGAIVSSIPLYSRSDFAKMHIRSTANAHTQRFWSSLGMKVSLIPFNELEYQLQKEEINAIEGGMSAIENAGYTSLLQEQNFNYVIKTNQSLAVGNVVMNLEEYQALPPAVQDALREISANTWRAEITPIEFAEKYDLTVITPNAEVQEVLNEGGEAIIQDLKKRLGRKKVEDFLTFMESIQ